MKNINITFGGENGVAAMVLLKGLNDYVSPNQKITTSEIERLHLKIIKEELWDLSIKVTRNYNLVLRGNGKILKRFYFGHY